MSWIAVLLLAAGAAWGGGVSVPLTVTPPDPPGFTQQISQTVTINAQSYTVTGTLTFTPVMTTTRAPIAGGNPVPAALSGLPDGTLGPVIAGFKNAAGQWQDAFMPGDPVYIEGGGWGNDAGLVRIDLAPCDITEWLDEEIGTTVPLSVLPHPDGVLVEVCRPDGAYHLTRGFQVGSPP